MDRPPCWPEGRPCPNTCAEQRYQRIVYNHTALYGPWAGYRFAGADLVTPDGQRINERRKRPIKIVVIDLQDYRENGIAAA